MVGTSVESGFDDSVGAVFGEINGLVSGVFVAGSTWVSSTFSTETSVDEAGIDADWSGVGIWSADVSSFAVDRSEILASGSKFSIFMVVESLAF